MNVAVLLERLKSRAEALFREFWRRLLDERLPLFYLALELEATIAY